MNLQILTSLQNYNQCSYLCFNESKDAIHVTFDSTIEEMFVPGKELELEMVMHNKYNRYKRLLDKFDGRVVSMTSSKYENVVDKMPVLFMSNITWDDRKKLKKYGFVRSLKDHHRRFLETNGSRMSGGFIFTKKRIKMSSGETFPGRIEVAETGIVTEGYITIPDPEKFKHIDPNITYLDYETTSMVCDMFAGVGMDCKGDLVYTSTMNQANKTKYILSLNLSRGIKEWKDKDMSECIDKELPENMKDYIYRNSQNIDGSAPYAITINISWGETDLFWKLQAYILRSLKTNILSGWNIDGFDNIHTLDKCPETILDKYYKFSKNDWMHSDARLIEKFNMFMSRTSFNTGYWISADMMIAYSQIKNPDSLSLKAAGKFLDVQKIDFSYEEIGLITRYNQYMWLVKELEKITDKKKYLEDKVPYLDLEDISNDQVLNFLKILMLREGDDTSGYIKRYEHVQKYALYDVLVPEAVCKSINYIDWVYQNADGSFIAIDEKLNRGVSYVLTHYLSREGYKRNMYISMAVEETYRPTGGYTAPVTKFKLEKGVVCDLDANSMYPGMMSGYNISCGTVYDDPELVKAMERQGYTFKQDKLDFTFNVDPLMVPIDEKISLESLIEDVPKIHKDQVLPDRDNLDRDFKCLQDIQLFGYTIQFTPFHLIGGLLKDVTYHERGAFFSGDINGDERNPKLKDEVEIRDFMMDNYNKFNKSTITPTHIKINTVSYTINKRKCIRLVKSVQIFSNEILMVTIKISNKSVFQSGVSVQRKVVYDRDVWIAQLDHVALYPHSQIYLGKTRKGYKGKMKPLMKLKEIYERGDGPDLTEGQGKELVIWNLKQLATKVLMNAMYGILNTMGAKSNNPAAAAMITTYGRRSIVDVYECLVMFGGYITSGDTDSAMANFTFIDIKLLNSVFELRKQQNLKKVSDLRSIVNSKLKGIETNKEIKEIKEIKRLESWNKLHWSSRLKNQLVDLGNIHLQNTKNVMTLGADGVFIFFLTLAKKNYLRMDVCSLEFEPIGIPFIKAGLSKIYSDIGLSILKRFGHRDNKMSLGNIQAIEYKRFDVLFTDSEYERYKNCNFRVEKPPVFVEVKRRFGTVQCKNAITASKLLGFDPEEAGELWFVTNGKRGIDFRALGNLKGNKFFFRDIKKSQVSKLNSYINSQRVLT